MKRLTIIFALALPCFGVITIPNLGSNGCQVVASGVASTAVDLSAGTVGGTVEHITVPISYYTGGGTPTITSSPSNTWIARPVQTTGGANAIIYYDVDQPSVNSTFTVTVSGAAFSLCIWAALGTPASGSSLDGRGGPQGAAAFSVTSIQPSSALVPTNANEALLSCVSFDATTTTPTVPSGYTSVGFKNWVNNTNEGIACAYQVQTTIVASTPQWAFQSNDVATTVNAYGLPSGPCIPVASANWNLGSTWQSCTGVGGVPGASDAINWPSNITVTITAGTSAVADHIVINTTGGQLVGSGTASLTLGNSSLNGIALGAGCTAIGGNCTSAFVLDGNGLSLACPNLTTQYCVAPITFTAPNIRLQNGTITTPGGGITVGGNTGSDVGVFSNLKCIGTTVDCLFGIYISSFTVSKVTMTGGSGSVVEIYGTTPTTCSISDVMALDITGTTNVLYGLNDNHSSGCTFSNINGSSDVAGTYAINCFNPGGSTLAGAVTVTNGVCKNYSGSVSSGGYAMLTGTASFHATFTRLVCENVAAACVVSPGGSAYNDSSQDVAYEDYSLLGSLTQFQFISRSANNTSANDVVMAKDHGNSWLFDLVGTSGALSYVMTHERGVESNTGGVGNNFVTNFAEPGVGTSTPTSLAFSNFTGGFGCISSEVSANIFSAIYAGNTVGVYSNNCWPNGSYTYSTGAYAKSMTGSTNFDNGVTAHPSFAAYLDTNLNPFTYDGLRTLSRVDELIGHLSAGSGTAEHLMTQLGNVWNGTNGAYTPQLVWLYMYYASVSQTGAIGNPTTYNDASPPQLFAAGAMMGN